MSAFGPAIVPGRHAGKSIVITGGARGIGLAYAQRLVAEGARVVLGDIRAEDGRAAVAALGSAARFVSCDVTKKAEVDALMAEAMAAHGRLDVCIANAGIVSHSPFLETTEEEWDRVMAINVKGVLLTGQAAARAMIETRKHLPDWKGGAIINIASVNAVVVQHGAVPYPVSKGAVHLLTRSMAIHLADHKIRVVAIGPGPTKTAMEAAVLADPAKQRIREIRTALRRMAEPEEVAAVASFLASEEASYITGQTLFVDGGRLVLNYMMPE
jgi:NAD(P)-dependent dehydrogenase (short-subunit alcohol dehydrogenase family)